MLPNILSNRDAGNIAQLKRYIVGVLNVGDAETFNEVLYVDGNAGDDSYNGKAPDRAFATIAAALSAASAYDVVAVLPGTYAEHITLATANVTLIGLGATPRQVLLLDATDSAVEMIAITASNVTVGNLMVQLGHANNVECVTVGACDYATIESCIFEKLSETLDEAIRLMGPNTNKGHIIRGCTFDTHTLGIVFEDSTTNASQVTIEDCLFKNGATADITDSADVQVNGVVIRGCYFQGAATPPTDFIVLDNTSSDGLLAGCYFGAAVLALTEVAVDAGIYSVGCYTEEGVNANHPN